MNYFILLSFIIYIINISYSSNERAYKPVIGIYGNPYPETDFTYNNKTYYVMAYIRWLEAFGAEVMAINNWYSESEIEDILNKVNGVLFMGGGRDFNLTSNWELKAKFILNFALKNNLPVYGTCMGFQLLNVIFAEDEKILSEHKYEDSGVEHSLILVKGIPQKLFSLFEDKELEILQNNPSTVYFHHDGIDKNDYAKNKKLNKIFYLTSIAYDKHYNFFTNTIEGKNSKIFGSQFHPEKVPYIRTENYALNHSMDSLTVSQLIGLYFVEECRKNENRFDEKEREKYDFFNTYKNNSKFIFNYDEEYFYSDKK
jgi:gamma-glutamyl hydrolase